LSFGQEIPDHSTFSKNRHGCVFREVFDESAAMLDASLVEGWNLAVDGTMVVAYASRQSRIPREQLKEQRSSRRRCEST